MKYKSRILKINELLEKLKRQQEATNRAIEALDKEFALLNSELNTGAYMYEKDTCDSAEQLRTHEIMKEFLSIYSDNFQKTKGALFDFLQVSVKNNYDDYIRLFLERNFLSSKFISNVCLNKSLLKPLVKEFLLTTCCKEHRYSNYRGFKVDIDKLFSLFE